jgi:tetratricopeptide (TPR) repeat protein
MASDYLAWLEETPLEALDLGKRQHQSIPLLMEHSLVQVSDQARCCLGLAGVLAMRPFEPEVIALALQVSAQKANFSLGELVDYGLLTRPDAQYQISHALAHTYARKKIAVQNDVLARLAQHYNKFSSEQVKLGLSGYSLLDAHRDHILAVQSACNIAGLLAEARAIVWAIEDYLDLQGHSRERIFVVQVGLQAARSDGSRYDEGSFLNLLGLAYAAIGDARKAIEYYEQALAILREIGDMRGEGAALGSLGLAYADLGDARKAIEYYKQALAIAREIGDRRGEANASWNLGLEYEKAGDLKRAAEMMQICVIFERETGHPDADNGAERLEAIRAKLKS